MSAHVVTIGGVTATVPEHARRGGISRQLLRYRLRTGVPQEHLFAAVRPNVKHDPSTVIELRRRIGEGERLIDVAPALGISESWARYIAKGLARKVVALEPSGVRP